MSPRTPLVSPSSYFRRTDRPSLGFAAGIVTVNAVLTTALLWWFVSSVIGQINVASATRQEAMSEVSGQMLMIFVATYLGWLLIAGVIHVFMWFAGADRGFGTTLAVVGEAMLVSVVMLPLMAVGFYLLIQQVPSDLDAALDFIERFAAGSLSGPLLLIGFVRTIWEASVQAVGLAQVHNISLAKTAIVTVVLGLLILVVA
jgi:hypothetical protein